MADQPSKPSRPSLTTRLVGTGARGASAAAKATGINQAAELAAEEAIVRALESPAVERALVRVLEGPAAEGAIERVLASPAVERALIEALDSEMVDNVWDRLLASDQAQKLVERVAEAPEVRAALTSQGVGLLEDLGRQVRRIAHRFDRMVEGLARAIARRPQRTEPTGNAGLITRALAFVLDAAIVNGAFLALTALSTFAISTFIPDFDRTSTGALAAGGGIFAVITCTYLFFFWTLAGQTLGMRLLGIRLDDYDGTPRLSKRTATRRLIGMVLAAIPLGLGFLAVLVSDRRRGLHDRIGRTEVILVDRDGQPESPDFRESLLPAR